MSLQDQAAIAAAERWRGATEARIRDAERRLDTLNGNLEKNAAAIGQLAVEGAKTRTRLAGLIVAANLAAGLALPLLLHVLHA